MRTVDVKGDEVFRGLGEPDVNVVRDDRQRVHFYVTHVGSEEELSFSLSFTGAKMLGKALVAMKVKKEGLSDA